MSDALQTPTELLAELWSGVGGDGAALGMVTLSGDEPQLPSSFRVGAAAQVSIAAAGLAAAEIWRLRSGQSQAVTVDMRHAVVECRSERYLRVDGQPPPPAWDVIAGVYKTRDRRFVRLHTNFAHHRDAVCRVLNCKPERGQVEAALLQWDGEAFETAAYAAGGVVALMRAHDQWAALPQAAAIAELPLIAIEKIGEAAPKPWPPGDRPLAGLRVLDLSRVIAGPVAGRTLAVHGADVMLVSSPDLPAIPWLTIDTGRGKLSSFVDLASEQGRETLRDLVAQADVFSQGYRPRALAARGFSPTEAARISPGIVYASLSAYGQAGPWAERRGFEFTGAMRDRPQPCGGCRRRRRWAEGIAGADARSCHRLSDGVGRDDGARTAGARRWQLACPGLAGADRTLAVADGPHGQWIGDRGFEERRHRAVGGRDGVGLRAAAGGSSCRAVVADQGLLVASGGAARQPCCAMAGAALTTLPQFQNFNLNCPCPLRF